MSMSSEKRLINPKAFDSDVPPLNKQARAVRRQPIKQRVERPADPEVLLDVLFGRAEASSGCREQVAAVGV